MGGIRRALRDAVRSLAGAPGFAVVSVLTLGLGIGVATAMFSLVDGVLLRSLPYPASGRLVCIFETHSQGGRSSVAPANFLDWRQQSRELDRLAAFSPMTVTLLTDEGPETVIGSSASADLFPALGVSPWVGSAFTPEHERIGGTSVIVLGHRLWQQRFGGDQAIVGRTITVNGAPATVLGIMPPGFHFPNPEVEFWQPLRLSPALASRDARFLSVVARLRSGTGLERAGSEMRGIADRLAADHPSTNRNRSIELVPLKESIVGSVRQPLLTLFGAVAIVIGIACANVANLLLVRASVRRKEFAIRAALGAGRRRLMLQVLTESLVLAIAGGALGLLLAWVAMGPMRSVSALGIPRTAEVELNVRALAFATVVSSATVALFGLVPAWLASRSSPSLALKPVGPTPSGATPSARAVLLVSEMALSIVLLAGAILLLRSFGRLTSVDPGFNTAGILATEVSLPERRYPNVDRRAAFFVDLERRLETAAGVERVGLVHVLPLRGMSQLPFRVRGGDSGQAQQPPAANYRVATPGYFETVGIPILRGRTFSDADTAASQPTAVVDAAFARDSFGSENPIGRAIWIANGLNTFYEIVGVVGDVRQEALDATGFRTIYVPFAQHPVPRSWVLLRANGDPRSRTGLVRQAVRDLDPLLAPSSTVALDDVVQETIARQRFSSILLALFAAMAVCLSAVGLYGVMAYAVSQRTAEIGLRIAMGAEPRHVSWLILRAGMKLAALGTGIGLVAAIVLSRYLQSLLFGVEPSDLTSYVVTTSVMLAVAILACVVPARRAMRVDPIVAIQGR